ncbi:unnamed protein product [Boreogadus saida]
MYGATVGSLRVVLQKVDPYEQTTAWQLNGRQGRDWQMGRLHVTDQPRVHLAILEARVGGETGDIAVDDVKLVSGPCAASGTVLFEKGRKLLQLATCSLVTKVGAAGNPSSRGCG